MRGRRVDMRGAGVPTPRKTSPVIIVGKRPVVKENRPVDRMASLLV